MWPVASSASPHTQCGLQEIITVLNKKMDCPLLFQNWSWSWMEPFRIEHQSLSFASDHGLNHASELLGSSLWFWPPGAGLWTSTTLLVSFSDAEVALVLLSALLLQMVLSLWKITFQSLQQTKVNKRKAPSSPDLPPADCSDKFVVTGSGSKINGQVWLDQG